MQLLVMDLVGPSTKLLYYVHHLKGGYTADEMTSFIFNRSQFKLQRVWKVYTRKIARFTRRNFKLSSFLFAEFSFMGL